MPVSEFCNREVVVVRRGDSIDTAAKLMREYHVGDVVVVDQRDSVQIPLGVITDRDVVIEVVAAGVSPEQVTAGDIMSDELVSIEAEADLLDATARMRREGVRRIVVVDSDGGLLGILALDDVLEILAEEMNDLAQISYRQVEREEMLRTAP
jgi:predicted transcriptional regulator